MVSPYLSLHLPSKIQTLPQIVGINFDFDSHEFAAFQSDNFPVVWDANGNQYTSWGDGYGFAGTPT